MRGVNLGGWLVIEKWITPSLFVDTLAQDEYGLCSELGKTRGSFIDEHYRTFITESDFDWLAKQGIEAVRLPVGYWLFGVAPYRSSIKYVDFAMERAAKYGLKLIIDLHGAPGSQNGRDHSGRAGATSWHMKNDNITNSLKIIEQLASRYAGHPSLYGIELLNEPSWQIPFRILSDFYQRGYEIVRLSAGSDTKVIFSDGFRHYSWRKLFSGPRFVNVVQDIHLYQVFNTSDRAMDFAAHLDRARLRWKQMIRQIQAYHDVMVGEWSLALPDDTANLPPSDTLAMQSYAKAQLTALDQAEAGWFFWTYKTEDMPGWSLRDCVRRDWLKL